MQLEECINEARKIPEQLDIRGQRISAFSVVIDDESRRRNLRIAGRGSKTILLHRFLIDAADDVEVKPLSGDFLDCRRANLVIVSRAEVVVGGRKQVGTTSKHKGVACNKQLGGWEAYVYQNGKKHHIGVFGDEDTAARARDVVALDFGGDRAHLNFKQG